jgi:putative flippase GtrA
MTVLNRIISEIQTLARFGMVGIVATILHLSVALLLYGHFNIAPLLANLLAFLAAFLFSFIGHYLWTFQSQRGRLSCLLRFLTISLFALSTNMYVLKELIAYRLLPESWAIPAAATVIPIATYLAARLWAFSNKHRARCGIAVAGDDTQSALKEANDQT